MDINGNLNLFRIFLERNHLENGPKSSLQKSPVLHELQNLEEVWVWFGSESHGSMSGTFIVSFPIENGDFP